MFREFFWTWIPWIFNKASATLDNLKTVIRVLYNELTQKKELVFLINNNIPISSVAFGPIEDSHVKWRCSLNPFIFVEPGFQFEEERHLSYLGFVVKIPASADKEAQDIDISDWVNELKWKGALTTNNEPTLKEIFILWSFSSGESYFHCLNYIHVEYITSSGDSARKGLMDPV
jgi:hypothetical protein